MSAVEVLPQLSNSELHTIAKKKLGKEVVVIDSNVSSFKGGNGHLGGYFHIEMTVKEESGKTVKLKFFMKTKITVGWQALFVVNQGVFEKEMHFYEDVSGCLRKFLSTDVFPESFLVVPGKIVLADAALEGYRPVEDFVAPLDYERVKLGLEALARLHVGSMIYEEKTGRKLRNDFPESAREANFTQGSPGLHFLRTGGECVAALAPHMGRKPEEVALLQEHVTPWMMKLEDYFRDEFPHRPVICQGDAWASNFLYKYDHRGKPLSAIIVDFQMTRLRSPAVDINMFMYVSMQMDDLKKWRESLLDSYYQVIIDEMKNCDLDATAIYPKEEFLQACIFYQIVGVIFSLMAFPFARIEPNLLAKAISTEEDALYFHYTDRRQQIIDWYKECPLLQRFVNGLTDELYENFIKTKRGLTEFTP